MHTSLIDGFFIKTQNHTTYTSITFVESNLNSDHLSIILHIPPNKLIARQPPPPPITRTTRIMNPIPQENLEKFKTKFFEENAIQLNNITTLLSLDQLTQNHGNQHAHKWTTQFKKYPKRSKIHVVHHQYQH